MVTHEVDTGETVSNYHFSHFLEFAQTPEPKIRETLPLACAGTGTLSVVETPTPFTGLGVYDRWTVVTRPVIRTREDSHELELESGIGTRGFDEHVYRRMTG